MRLVSVAIIAAILLAFFESKQSDQPTDKPIGSFKGRLQNALAISDFTTRDKTLQGVALDAAAAGDGEAVTQCVAGILARDLKDEVASQSALRLANAGLPEAANAVATTISDRNLRKTTLEKLAEL